MKSTCQTFAVNAIPLFSGLLLAAAILGAAWAEPVELEVLGITGTDERRIVERDGAPWNAIGRLNITTGGFCTATVIGPRQVLTAAHCLWNRRMADWYPPCALHFLAGYRRGEYRLHALISELNVAPGYDPVKPHPGRDWAVLTLDQDVGDAGVGIADLDPGLPVVDATLSQAGYSRDRRHVLTLNLACRRRGVGEGLFLHDCDATFGDSGSPVFHKREGHWRLTGVHVAVRGRGETALGVAGTLSGLREWLRDHPARRSDKPIEACALPMRVAVARRSGCNERQDRHAPLIRCPPEGPLTDCAALHPG